MKLRLCVFAAVLCVCLGILLSGTGRVRADNLPVVEITAKRFAFTPDKITLKKGQTRKATSAQRRRDPRLLPAPAQTR